MQKPDMFYGAPSYIFDKAKKLRKAMTLPELVLWQRLKKRQLKGYRFRRQHPIAEFVVDFYCHPAKLAIEIDGGFHNRNDQQYQDLKRTEELNRLGLTVIRFTNDQVINDLDTVLKKIEGYLL